jgi:putative ABC transport system permease protein
MWAVVGSALAARRGQAIIVGLVALLASAALAAAPWYAVTARQQAGVAAVTSAPIDEPMVSISRRVAAEEPAPADPIGEIRRQYEPAGFHSVGGGFAAGEIVNNDQSAYVNVAYREAACDHLLVTGACPTAVGEVAISAVLADQLGLAIGDEAPVIRPSNEEPGRVRVVGTYQLLDPADPYWGEADLVSLGSLVGTTDRETVFTVPETLPEYAPVTYTYELVAIPEAFATVDEGTFLAGQEPGLAELRRQRYAVVDTGLVALLERIEVDRRNLLAGVAVGVAVLLLLAWFTLVVLLRNAVVQIRGDIGWWRLHGAPTGRGWISALGQSAAPLVTGAAIGAVAGIGVGRLIGENIAGTDDPRAALRLGLGLVGLAVAGGLVAVVATQLGTLRTPVRDLIRRIPPRRQRWRRSLVDVVLVVLAAAAVIQALSVGRDADGLALLAPGLAALGLALVAAWAVPPLVAGLAIRALRAGRLATALIAASMARRPDTHRPFALVAVAVALVTTALAGWDTAARTQQQRASLEVGADRVITLATVDSARLLAAVRAADPEGRYAMAVVHRVATGDHPTILAVDSTRLAAVAGWREQYGGEATDVVAALRPPAPDPLLVTTDRLTVQAAGDGRLIALLRTVDTGEPVEAAFGPLGELPERYTVDVPCGGGCRLLGVQVASGWAELHELAGADGARLAGDLTDPARWRPALGPEDLGPVITGDGDALRLTAPAPQPGMRRDPRAFIVDSPVRLPALAAGWRQRTIDEFRLQPLFGPPVPAELVGTAALLPQVGQMGLVVDLEYAERLVPSPVPGGVSQVWLAPAAPPAIIDDLRSAGLVPIREDSLGGRTDRLAAEGSAVAIRFQAAVAVVGLLLAAGAVVVLAARERTDRTGELAALRAQGVAASVVRVVGWAGPAALTASATLIGLAAGVVGAVIARGLYPGFVDGWAVLPVAPLRPHPVAGALLLAVVVLGGAVALIRVRGRA